MKTILILLFPFISFGQTSPRNCEKEIAQLQQEIDSLSTQMEYCYTHERQLFQKRMEIETMKKIMRNYIVQIDSLNTKSHEQQREIEALRLEISKE